MQDNFRPEFVYDERDDASGARGLVNALGTVAIAAAILLALWGFLVLLEGFGS